MSRNEAADVLGQTIAVMTVEFIPSGFVLEKNLFLRRKTVARNHRDSVESKLVLRSFGEHRKVLNAFAIDAENREPALGRIR